MSGVKRVCLALALLVLSGGILPWVPLRAGPARADADPASDILLGSPTFYPYQPMVAEQLKNQLQQALAALNKKGLNLKVAIIASPIDLGAIPNMFGKPQTYADFLEREISFNRPQPLLVVMPTGFGVSHVVAPTALNSLKVDTVHQSNGLAVSAILAVQRIALAAGKPISTGRITGAVRSSGSGTSPLITFGAPAILVLVGAFVAARLQRRRAD